MKPRILVVDDEKDICELVRLFLEPNGYEMDDANTCARAVELMKKNLYQIVLLDIRLPDGDGFEMIPKLKSFNPFANIIMMTAYTSMDNVVACLEAGAVDYFTKPFRDTTVFLKAVSDAAERIARWKRAIPMFPR